jgi:predicted ATPase with chaperone activity
MAGAFSVPDLGPMTSANSLVLILRRLDEIERKLDRILEELRTPTAIGYSARRGNHPRKD